MPLKPFVFCLCLVAAASASAGAEILDEDALRSLANSNTITGRYVFGGWFSEYHAPDGRVLGNNGWQDNDDACWTTHDKAICYSYGAGELRQTYCFTIEKQGDSLLLRNFSDGALNAIAKVEPANPRNHSDNGKSWTCEAKISSGPLSQPRLAGLAAKGKQP